MVSTGTNSGLTFCESFSLSCDSAGNSSETSLDDSDITSAPICRKSSSRQQPKSYFLKLKCEICGDEASGFHYGVHACEGCKGFFRRTITLKLTYKKCSSSCKISLKSRNKCQFCRYNKCLKLGMSRDAIRYGRISKNEKMKMISKYAMETAPKHINCNHQDEKLVKLTEILVSAFHDNISLTNTKMNEVWNQRNTKRGALITLDSMNDVLFPHPNIDHSDGISDTSILRASAGKLANCAESTQHPHSVNGRLDTSIHPIHYLHPMEDTASGVANQHVIGSSNVEELTPQQKYDLRIKEILDFLESMDDIVDAKCENVIEKPERKINYVKELLKEYENVPVTILNIDKILDGIPAMRRALSVGKITAAEIEKHALHNHRSIVTSVISFMREMNVHARIERGLGRSTAEVRQALENYYATKDQSIVSGYKHADGVPIMKCLFKSMQHRTVKMVGELTKFAKCIPGFNELTLEDQIILLKFSSFEAIFVLLSCTIFQNGTIVPDLNAYVTFNFMEKMKPIGAMVLTKLKFAQKVADLNLFDEDLALYLSAIILFSDRPGLTDSSKIEELQANVLRALEAQLKANHPHNRHLFAKLLLKTADVRQLVAQHILVAQHLAESQSMIHLFHPLVSELLNNSLCNIVVPMPIMDTLDEYFDRADYLIQEAEQVPLPESKHSTQNTKWKSFRKNLHKSYTKSLQDYTDDVPLRSGSDLMRDVINNYDCPRLLVNLFPVNDGYSVTLIKSDGTSAESLQMPYEECELLEYIDNEQLPPIIVDCLHKNHPEAFICGCVIAEIRDYRISIDEDSYEVHCTLLKPTQQTLNNDVNIVSEESSGSFKWGTDDKLMLESLMTLATAEPLCLDTSPTVAIVKNKIHRKKGRFNIRPMKRLIHKNGLIARRRMQMAETHPLPSALKLHTFLMKRKRSQKQHTQSLSPDVKLPIGVVDVWRKEPLILTSAPEIDCSNYLTALPSNSIDSTEIIEVQSILLESESGNRDVISRIAIGQRPSDMHYFGMLQSNKYFKLSKPDIQYTNQIFSLGTEHKANLYILQYHELFTEDGRRPVKVTVRHANKPPVVYHVPNQQQPWQLAQEKSLYSVGSVTNIPPSKWKPMTPSTHTELKLKLQQQQNVLQKQKAQQKLLQSLSNASQNPAVTAPSINRSTTPSQAPMQNPLNFQGTSVSRPRVVRTKSGTLNESTAQVQLTPQLLASGGIHQHGHLKSQTTVTKTPTQEPARVVVAKTVNNGNTQTVAMTSSALANAIGQIGGTVNVQVPVMTVNAQRNSVDSHDRQAQTTAAVIRMPIGIAGSSNSSGQIATLNLIGGSNLLTTGTGNISIPASQLPPNFAMQLTSLANGSNQQQISLVTQPAATAQAAVQSQQISFVNQSTNNAPFTIITNDNWQARETGNITPQQQTLTIAPRTQIAPSRNNQGQQPQSVQLVQQLRIPAHILSQLTGGNLNPERIQIITSQGAKNVKKRN